MLLTWYYSWDAYSIRSYDYSTFPSLPEGSVNICTSLVAQTVKRLSTMWETQVRSLGREGPWRRKWQSTPVLLPGKSNEQKSLVDYSPWLQRVGHD